jgi:hypothetical protein
MKCQRDAGLATNLFLAVGVDEEREGGAIRPGGPPILIAGKQPRMMQLGVKFTF